MKMVMAVTNDEYELPVIIEKSYKAMARRTGYHEQTISRQCRGLIQESMSDIRFVDIKLIGDKMEELIKEMRDLIKDINVNEIADHLNEESLWNWCGVWRQTAERIMDDMEKEIAYDLQD